MPPISSDKLNWKHCSKNKKESVSYPRRIWNRYCTNLRGNTCRTSWIVKDVHSFFSDSLFVTKSDFRGNLSKKLSKVSISAISHISSCTNFSWWNSFSITLDAADAWAQLGQKGKKSILPAGERVLRNPAPKATTKSCDHGTTNQKSPNYCTVCGKSKV